MTKHQALARLKEILADHKAQHIDTEEAHRYADDVLIEFLKALGYTEIAEAWDVIPMWYS